MPDTGFLTFGTLAPAFGGLSARAILTDDAVRGALRERGRTWIVPSKARLRELVRIAVAGGRARSQSVLVLVEVPGETAATSRALFDRVLARPALKLGGAELAEVLALPEPAHRCIGGLVDADTRTVLLYRGDLSSLVVPFSDFRPSGTGTRPDFAEFTVTDYGSTLRFGDYEAAFDAVLYERDAEYRGWLKRQRLAEDGSFGASLRRLRSQRRLTRDDFPGVDARTIARIENGEVTRPHGGTLQILADRLGVTVDQIEEY